MKKLIIIPIIIGIVIAIIVAIKPRDDIQTILAKYETTENDGYGENGGYIVSKKTSEGYRYGYINNKGKLILDLEYNMIHRIPDIQNENEVYLIAVKDGRYGVFINNKNIINNEYQFIDYNSVNQIFILNKNDKYGAANVNGEIIIDVDKKLLEAKGIYIYIEENESQYVCDNTGKKVNIDFNVTIQKTENEEYYIKTIYKDNDYKYQISDKYGNIILNKEYNFLEYAFKDYFIASNEEGKQGVIDVNGNIRVDFKYTLVQKVQNTQVIRTLNVLTNETEIYSSEIEKVCALKNATIETKDNILRVYNESQENEFDFSGKMINNN